MHARLSCLHELNLISLANCAIGYFSSQAEPTQKNYVVIITQFAFLLISKTFCEHACLTKYRLMS